MQLGQGPEATKEFQEALKLRPDDAAFRGNLATMLLQKSDFDAAQDQLQQALKREPDNASLHYDLALALKFQDNLPGAIAEFQRAIQLDPNLADAYYSLGVTLWQKGDFPAAAEQLQHAVEVRPDYAEAYYTLGTVYKQLNKLPQAAQALREAIRLQPSFPGAHTTLGAVLRQQGDTAGADAESRTGEQLAKQKTSLQAAIFATNSGNHLLNVGDIDGAISQLRNAVKLSPNYAVAHYQLAVALSRKGERTEAAQEFQKATELDPRLKPPSP
jgi:Flp pilus assembly protein TadD